MSDRDQITELPFIRTRGIELCSSDGQPRVRLVASEDDATAGMMMLDLFGRPRMLVGVGAGGAPEITALRGDGSAELSVCEMDGQPAVLLYHNKQPRLFFTLAPDGSAIVRTCDGNGELVPDAVDELLKEAEAQNQ